VQHQAEQQRFIIEPSPGLLCRLDYQRQGDRLVIQHTGVPDALRGQGLAGVLVLAALRWLAPQGLQLVPACSYVQTWLARQRRWQRLLAPAPAQALLNHWFGALDSSEDGQVLARWFKKDPAFDEDLRQRFGELVEQAQAGGLRNWDALPWGALARLLLLDQLARNLYRGQAQAFAGDALALQAALALLARAELAQDLTPIERWFVLMPLEHAEDLALQQRCVAEFEALVGLDARLAGALDYARRHLAVIQQFGRFPHRNEVLGRASSAAELDYLSQPGAGF
jgi:uncharacterized protein (DUF924 family)/predicted GNAT family acetyltransferase